LENLAVLEVVMIVEPFRHATLGDMDQGLKAEAEDARHQMRHDESAGAKFAASGHCSISMNEPVIAAESPTTSESFVQKLIAASKLDGDKWLPADEFEKSFPWLPQKMKTASYNPAKTGVLGRTPGKRREYLVRSVFGYVAWEPAFRQWLAAQPKSDTSNQAEVA
jgi:hypothetical protein